MNFKEFLISEATIDIPRKYFDKSIFNDYKTDTPILKSSVKKMIEKQINAFNKFAPVLQYRLIGSILGKKYRKTADLDINVLFDVPERKREQKLAEIRSALHEINGKFVPGTEHPVNYFVIVDPERYKIASRNATNVYDIATDTFLKKSKMPDFDINLYVKDFENAVKEIDFIKGELKRDLFDYEEIDELDNDEVENLEKILSGKVAEIETSINTLVDVAADIKDKRFQAFTDEMSPEEIRKYGVNHNLPANVIYKLLEKYFYFSNIQKLKDIIGDDKELSKKEINKLNKEVK